MRTKGFDKLAFLVVLCAAALVALAALGTGPAYSDESRPDPAEIHHDPAGGAAEIASASSQPQPAVESHAEVRTADPDGYEWSGSRPADQRYLWSHRPN